MPLVKSRGLGSSSSVAGPFPSPLSPWQPAHLRSYTALPAVASPACAHAAAGASSKNSSVASASEPEARSPPRDFSMSRMFGLPPSRQLPGGLVEVDDDLPDLLVGQTVLPRRHDRVPRRGFLRESRSAFRDPPEEIRLLEHGDGAGILEVRRRWVEALGE